MQKRLIIFGFFLPLVLFLGINNLSASLNLLPTNSYKTSINLNASLTNSPKIHQIKPETLHNPEITSDPGQNSNHLTGTVNYIQPGKSWKTSKPKPTRLAGLHFGPIDALKAKIEELDNKANKHWKKVYRNSNFCRAKGLPPFDQDVDDDGQIEQGCPKIPEKVQNYWKNNPNDAPDALPPPIPPFSINQPDNNTDTNEKTITVEGTVNTETVLGANFNVTGGDSVSVLVCFPDVKDSNGNSVCGVQDTVPLDATGGGLGEASFEFTANSVELDTPAVKSGCKSLSGVLGGGGDILGALPFIGDPSVCASTIDSAGSIGDEREVVAQLHRTNSTSEVIDTDAITVFFDDVPVTSRINFPRIGDTIPALQTDVSGTIVELDERDEVEKIEVWSTGPIAAETVTVQPSEINSDGSWTAENVKLISDTQTIRVRVTDDFTNTSDTTRTTFADTVPIFDKDTIKASDGVSNLGIADLNGSGDLSDSAGHRITVKLRGADTAIIVYDTATFPSVPNAQSTPEDTVSMSFTDPDGDIWSGTIPESAAANGDSISFILKGVDIDEAETTVLTRNGSSFLYGVENINVGPIWYVNDDLDGNDVFTTDNGNNSNDGDPDAPFRTVSHAMKFVESGDTVKIDHGTYSDSFSIPVNNLTVTGAGSDSTIIDPSSIPAPVGIRSRNRKNLLIKNLKVRQAQFFSGASDGLTGIGLDLDMDSSVIKNITAEKNERFGFAITGKNNLITQNNAVNNKLPSGRSIAAGIGVQGKNNSVINNIIKSNEQFGLLITDLGGEFADENLVRRNLVKNNSTGIFLQGTKNNKITQNKVINNTAHQFGLGDGATGDSITKNNVKYGGNSGITTNGLFDNVSFKRNYWNTTNKETIQSKRDGDRSSKIPVVPFRLGRVDTSVNADTLAPLEPVGLQALDTGITKVTWEQVTQNDNGSALSFSGDFYEYRIYRSSDDEIKDWKKNATLIGTTRNDSDATESIGDSSDTDFIDNSSGDFFYRITAVDSPFAPGGDGTANVENESYFSGILATDGRIDIQQPETGHETNTQNIHLSGLVDGQAVKPSDEIRIINKTNGKKLKSTDGEVNLDAGDSTWNTTSKLQLETDNDSQGLKNIIVSELYPSGMCCNPNNSRDTDQIEITYDNQPPVNDASLIRVTDGSDTINRSQLDGSFSLDANRDHDILAFFSSGADVANLFLDINNSASSNDTSIEMVPVTTTTLSGTTFVRFDAVIAEEKYKSGEEVNFIIQSADDASNTTKSDSGGVSFKYQVNWLWKSLERKELSIPVNRIPNSRLKFSPLKEIINRHQNLG